jgi:Terminase small subunit
VITMPRLKNRRHEAFAIDVAACTPYDRAYIAAGYTNSGWAVYNGNRLAHVPAVADRIAELQVEFGERSSIHAEYLRRQLLPIVEANYQDLFEPMFGPDGQKIGDKIRAISDLPRRVAAAISKVKVDPESGAVTEVTLDGKIGAATVLLRSVGGFVDRTELTGKDGATLEQLISSSYHIQVITGVPRSPDDPPLDGERSEASQSVAVDREPSEASQPNDAKISYRL